MILAIQLKLRISIYNKKKMKILYKTKYLKTFKKYNNKLIQLIFKKNFKCSRIQEQYLKIMYKS